MAKKKSPRPIPPLSLGALDAVEKMERYARTALTQCDHAWSYNREKAIRILRTCVVEVFDRQLDYYRTTPFYDPAWISEIADTTVDSALGLNNSTNLNYAETRLELLQTLSAHVLQKEESTTSQRPTNVTSPARAGDSIAQQIKRLQEECRMTAEEIAEGIGVEPRSVYRHLAGDAVPRRKQLSSYEKLFTNKTGRSIHLETS